MHCAYLSFWGASDPAPMAAACAQWVRDTQAVLAPHGSGEAFQNYIDPELTGWEHAYYGANLARLQRVKRRYDPDGRFAFAQGVSR
jgi:FAD/FMN-containing dehydrogenase